jgi:hypothetical protein
LPHLVVGRSAERCFRCRLQGGGREDTAGQASSGTRGNLQKICQLTPVSYRVFLGTMGLQIVVNYEMTAQFDKAEANVRWTLVKQDGKWNVEGFYVGSDALME